MKNLVSSGETIDLAAPYARVAGEGLLVGSIFGVSKNDAANAEVVPVQLTGEFDLTKTGTQAWTVGARIYWDNTAKACTNVASTNKLIGVATIAVAGGAGDTVGRVRLGGAFTL